MKALLICFFVVIAVTTTVAQNQINIRFGMNASSAHAKHALFNSYSPMMRNYLGIEVNRLVSDVSVVSIGINYSQRGFRRVVNELTPSGTFSELIMSKSKVDYAGLSFAHTRILHQRVMISGGCYLGMIGQIKQEGVLRTTTSLQYLNNSDLPEISKLDYGISIGIGYQWFERWILEAHFSQGLKQLYVNPDYYNNAKMRTYSFGIGYILTKR